MAIDHDASEENNQPDHDGNRDEKAPPRKRWATERDEPVTTIGRHRNIMDVHLSLAVAPAGDDDVDSHVNSVGTRIGVSKGRATVYCDVGTMLRRMPRILEFCRSGALPHERLSTIAKSIVAVSDNNLPEVEKRFLRYLRPRKDFQALPGPRVFARELRRIVESVEPISTPPDDDEPQPVTGESYGVDNEYPGDHGSMEVIMRKDRLAEFDATVRAIKDAKVKAGEDCSYTDAMIAMSRGDFAGAKVTMNIYVDGDADEDDVQVWLDGAGWLPKYVSEEWLARAAVVRLSADSQTGGYAPTEAQKARVRGRDGQCRFPGCDVPAHRCQVDHVINFNPDAAKNPLIHANDRHLLPLGVYLDWLSGGQPKGTPGMRTAEGVGAGFVVGNDANNLGVTATWNLQCLCQHHHNLKTSRHWHAQMHPDGSVTWSDHTGEAKATTVPHGPIAHIKRQTFAQRATRLASTIHGDNLRRMKAEADAAKAMEQADIDAALRRHARETAKYEEELAEFTAGPLNSADPAVAAEARALADAADDGWPCVEDPTWDPTWDPDKETSDMKRRDGRNAADDTTDDIWASAPMKRNPDMIDDEWTEWNRKCAAGEWEGVGPETGSAPEPQPGTVSDSRFHPHSDSLPRSVCRPHRRRATIDAEPGSAPEPPPPLGPHPDIPF